MKILREEAFRVAILTEKNSYDLYRNASVMVPEGPGKRVLERLAREQAKLIGEMLKYCPDSFPDLLKQVSDQCRPRLDGYAKQSPERRVFDHLRAALRDKHACIDRYATYVKTFREPTVCLVFELALSLSRKQFGFIAEEYRQAEQRVHRPGSNRRIKRAHLGVIHHPTPNKHSQLFISLLDCGRHSPF